jgi:cyclic beta-1,2-glucan synthetase
VQLDRPYSEGPPTPGVTAPDLITAHPGPPVVDERVEVPDLTFANGVGGFVDGGRGYAVVLEGAQETPAPWTNVIANPGFGTMVTASG